MSKDIKIYDINGAVVGDYTLDDKYIELEKGEQAVHDVVVAFQASLRAGTACTKNRSKVRGGGAKPFRQNGTGRARSGSIRNPIWRGGGTIFGPQPRSFAKKINKKVRSLAIKRAFSERVNEEAVILLNELALADHKTKNAKTILNNLNVDRKALIIVNEYDDNALKAFANLQEALLIKASSVNVYQMLNYNKVIVAQDAIETLLERFA
jgi:large subunit ribosomal protein L4